MRKHPVLGVLALALLLLASGAFTLHGGNQTVQADANGECCILVDGACVPCDGTKGASTGAGIVPATLASAKFARATTQLTSAGCDPSQCEPMTPEQCAALGCDPGQCAGSSGCSTDARMIKATATTSASGCGSAPCAPAPGCGSGSGCAASSDSEI